MILERGIVAVAAYNVSSFYKSCDHLHKVYHFI